MFYLLFMLFWKFSINFSNCSHWLQIHASWAVGSNHCLPVFAIPDFKYTRISLLLFIFHTSFNCRLALFICLVCVRLLSVLTMLRLIRFSLSFFLQIVYIKSSLPFDLCSYLNSPFFHHRVWNPVCFLLVWDEQECVRARFSFFFLKLCVCVWCMIDMRVNMLWKIFTSKGIIKIICVRGLCHSIRRNVRCVCECICHFFSIVVVLMTRHSIEQLYAIYNTP